MQDKVRLWPTAFNGNTIRIQDVTKGWWIISIRVKPVSEDTTGDWTAKKEVIC